MVLSVGSKVFLMGEYLALNGGPALLASLDPRFELRIEKGEGQLNNISLESPAGIFYSKNKKFFSEYNIEFFDPFNGSGGWGASSAQYAMLAAFFYGQSTIQTDAQWNLDLQQIDKDYLKITSQNSAGLPPSGMDVIAQLRGGLVLIDRNKGRIENIVWPFNDISFLMFATGVKVPTHLHLKSLVEIPFAKLSECVESFNAALISNNKPAFVEAMNEFRSTLLSNNLEISTTTEWINKIKSITGVLAVKGCGALGADVILFLVEKANEATIISELKKMGATRLVSKEQLTGPLHVSFDSNTKGASSEALQ
jgi:mevalonate kinase